LNVSPPGRSYAGSGVAATFLDVIRADLDAIEQQLRQSASSSVHHVDAISHHVLLAGGKRLRPACVVLSARALSEAVDPVQLVRVATAMELVHTATLVHDDVVDNTWVRRGTATANAVFGNGVAVLTGDFLLARAVSMLAQEEHMRLIHTLADVTVEMSEGEVLEIVATGNPEVSLEAYYELIRKKTAAFMAGCCRCGAILAEANPDEEEALSTYGMNLGLAFQLTDDLLDYVGDPAITGKPVGSDLREGRATMPFLLGLQNSKDGKRETLLGAFGNAGIQEQAVSLVVQTLRMLGALDQTREAAQERIESAKMALRRLRPSRYRDALEDLADYVGRRDR